MKNQLQAIFLAFSLIISLSAYGQQEYQFSQVTKSLEFLNPAYNASKNGVNALVLNRMQWMGVEGAPKTVALSAHVPTNESKLGVGIIGVGETVGLRSVLNAGLTINSHVKVSDAGFLAGGLFAGATITKYDTEKAIAYTEYDNLTDYESVTPVAGLGIYFFNEHVHAGVSSYYTISEQETDAFNENLSVNFNIAGVASINSQWSVKPYALVKYSTKYLNAYEGGATVLWDDFIWVGAGYRYNSAVIGLLDVQVLDELRIGYSYDHTLGTTAGYNAGSHEIRLTFELIKEATTEQLQFR